MAGLPKTALRSRPLSGPGKSRTTASRPRASSTRTWLGARSQIRLCKSTMASAAPVTTTVWFVSRPIDPVIWVRAGQGLEEVPLVDVTREVEPGAQHEPHAFRARARRRLGETDPIAVPVPRNIRRCRPAAKRTRFCGQRVSEWFRKQGRDPAAAQSVPQRSVRTWLILTQDRFGNPRALLSSVSGKPARGS